MLKPLGDRVVLKKIEKEENVTKSGLVLPSSAKEESNIAEVLAVANEIDKDEKTAGQLKVGDKVVYSKYAGSEFEIDGEKVIVIKYEDILAVIE